MNAVAFAAATHPFVTPPEIATGAGECPVAIVGAGPVGLAMAVDLARKGIRCVVLERGSATVPGSKAICWAKRTLEIFDRLGCGRRMRDKGIVWNIGRTFYGDSTEPVYEVDLLPEQGHEFPAFVNLQQYYVEQYLLDSIRDQPLVEMRWQNEVMDVTAGSDDVTVAVRTPAGPYRLHAKYLLAADGSKSTVRRALGLEFVGRIFEEYFLIADIRMRGDFPPERRFWFDPPFSDGQSALLHKQPDDLWRTDFQLGPGIDRAQEMRRENVARRVRGLVGPDREFDFEWISIYRFECRRLERFVHGRVIFIGDAAHIVSPFGARGGNGGIQDIDNLAWKLACVLAGKADARLLDSYDAERVAAADENILHSSRATDFMTPKNAASVTFRKAVLELAARHPFARSMVNSGRLSTPAVLTGSPLNTADESSFGGAMVPGASCADAPLECNGRTTWLLPHLGGAFTTLYFGDGRAIPAELTQVETATGPLRTAAVSVDGNGSSGALVDSTGRARQRYDARPGTLYLIRPDQHVAARWRNVDAGKLRRALATATAGGGAA